MRCLCSNREAPSDRLLLCELNKRQPGNWPPPEASSSNSDKCHPMTVLQSQLGLNRLPRPHQDTRGARAATAAVLPPWPEWMPVFKTKPLGLVWVSYFGTTTNELLHCLRSRTQTHTHAHTQAGVVALSSLPNTSGALCLPAVGLLLQFYLSRKEY